MKFKLLKTAAAFVAAAVLLSVTAAAKPAVSAESAVLMDALTGRVLWEKNAGKQAPIASTTKIMTGLLVAEECDLQAEVAIPPAAVGIEGSSLYLESGEVRTVEELLYGMMLHSGNDAAAALALYCGGSLGNFVEKMNRKARELGLDDTHFANPHGLDAEDNYATALDLARLAAYAMENPIFYDVVSTKVISFDTRVYTNHNKLLWRYPGAVGIKTGYTSKAGRILVSSAERDGRRLIAVTIDAPNDWQDHAAMLDYGYASYSNRVLADVQPCEAEVQVIGGGEMYAKAVLREDFSYPVAENETLELQYHLPSFVYPPIIAGEQAGELVVLIDGVSVAVLPLFWKYSVLEGA